jgi:hypothetical protein
MLMSRTGLAIRCMESSPGASLTCERDLRSVGQDGFSSIRIEHVGHVHRVRMHGCGIADIHVVKLHSDTIVLKKYFHIRNN